MSDNDKITTEGREKNAAVPSSDMGEKAGGPERYPPVAKDDSVQAEGEGRSFDPAADAPKPRQGAGDGSTPTATQEGRLGPEGDPAEGKR